VLVERVLPDAECQLEIKTAAVGFGEVWNAVVADFVERYSPIAPARSCCGGSVS
jgi:hypothetical protein